MKKLTKISAMHYFKLAARSALLIVALVLYIIDGDLDTNIFASGVFSFKTLVLGIIWIVFAVEMMLRFFPSNLESMGCQKQFPKNYQATGKQPDMPKAQNGVLTVFTSWIALNAVIAAMYYAGVIDRGILLLVALC